MQLPVNTFKRAICRGETQIGLWSQLGSPTTVEMIAGAAFDWIGLDAEHGPSDLVGIYSQLQACQAAGRHAMVRLPSGDAGLIKQYLDIGVQTLVFPQIETAGQARELVAATRYPPKGVRGYCSAPRASGFGRVRDYPFACEEEICILVQPENRRALDNIEAMAAVDGIDGLFVGPGDLSAEMGFLHRASHPTVVETLLEAGKRVRAAGKAAGIICSDETLTRRYMEVGYNIVAVGSDQGILVRGADELAARYR
jgi:4-hydroxy-2-oxoheptanedioate aldolase